MDDYSDEYDLGPEAEGVEGTAETTPEVDEAAKERDRALLDEVTKRIRADKKHHEDAFKRMRTSMEIARRGAKKDWPEAYYVCNIVGRHINQAVAALYAKNPKAIARRRERLDFRLWDENEQSLMMAAQTLQMYQQSAMAMGLFGPPPPEVEQAMLLLQDFQEGMAARKQIESIGKALEILFGYYQQEAKPIDFKRAMKKLVRRAKTCCVGYVELGFQREYDQNMDVTQSIQDHRQQLGRIRTLQEQTQDEDRADHEQMKAKVRELELSIESLAQQEYVLIREGLVFDFPQATRVIPDRLCKSLVGFEGARWVTVEYMFTPDQVQAMFGKDLKKHYTEYTLNGARLDESTDPDLEGRGDLVCVWKMYDKQAGLVYYLADGCHEFLKPPAPPDVYVEDFWPLYAITFNDVEDEDEKGLFPPSDVELLMSMQVAYNDARQGQSEHRQAARPRWVAAPGAFSDDDAETLATLPPFHVARLKSIAPGQKIEDLLMGVPVSGVDPNLYETGPLFEDVQLSVGAQEAQFGATSKATATESSIAEGSRVASVDSNVDDLDNFLGTVARAAGQIILREVGAETAAKICGPGVVWPEFTLEEIADEIHLEIEAGSSGRPNQAQEIRNWREILPYLIQMPTINPMWLAKETLRRLDDRMDLTGAMAQNFPAIVSLNRMSQAGPGDPGSAPEDQGGEGEGNGAPQPQAPPGGEPGMGTNQVPTF